MHDSVVGGSETLGRVLRFEEYEQLVEAAQSADLNAYLIVLVGGDAGPRCGEMMALEWRDIDLGKRQICVQRSQWEGHVTAPRRPPPVRTDGRASRCRSAQARPLRSSRVLRQAADSRTLRFRVDLVLSHECGRDITAIARKRHLATRSTALTSSHQPVSSRRSTPRSDRELPLALDKRRDVGREDRGNQQILRSLPYSLTTAARTMRRGRHGIS